MAQNEPLSQERLAELHARHERNGLSWSEQAALLADNERLHAALDAKEAREAALREALATLVMPWLDLDGVQLSPRRLVGISTEFILKARALLASSDEGETTGEREREVK